MIGQEGRKSHLCAAGMSKRQSQTVAQGPPASWSSPTSSLSRSLTRTIMRSQSYVKRGANSAARQVPAPLLQGGWPQHLPAHRRAPDAVVNRPHPRARPRPCGAVDASDSAVRAPPTAPGAPPVGCHSGLRPISGRSLRPALWAHARPAPPAAPTRRRPRPPGSARAGAGACVSVRERA